MAKKYMQKCRAEKKDPKIRIAYLPNDGVGLLEVTDKTSEGRFVVPSFITFYSVRGSKPFKNCKFKEVYIDNTKNPDADYTGMFAGIDQIDLTVSFEDTKQVRTMAHMFEYCSGLEKITLKHDDSEIKCKTLANAFTHCEQLNTLVLGAIDFGKTEFETQEMGASDIKEALEISGVLNGTKNVQHVYIDLGTQEVDEDDNREADAKKAPKTSGVPNSANNAQSTNKRTRNGYILVELDKVIDETDIDYKNMV